MSVRTTFLSLTLLFGLGAIAPAAQEILLVQIRVPVVDDVDANFLVLNSIAEELDNEGRVIPIVWSLTDPVFRGAFEAKAVVGNVETPTEEEARIGSESLKTAWYMIVQAEKKGGQLVAKARLFKRGGVSPVWSDEKNLAVQIGTSADFGSTGQSLARTWAAKLSEGPFKGIPARPKVETPDPDRGSVSETNTGRLPKVDDSYKMKADQLIKQGMVTEAVNLLRDAVDADPLDPARREELAKAMLAAGLDKDAATQAANATQINPERNDLRLIAVRAWLNQGRPDEAQKVLNEALARNPNLPETQLLVGDVALAKGEPGKAVEAYTKTLRAGENVEARVGRACAYAASGWPEPCQADIAAIPADKVALYYPRIVSELERALQNVAGELRETIRAARLTPKKTAVIERASRNLRASAGLARLAALYPPPAKHRDSHARRDLAHNLLQQACGEALEFAKSGKEDIADESSISLGEALKQFQQIREQYEKESTNKTP
ncbi:MAG: tetratricopeptide repeat protein [Fimbriimonadaceae bacterium]|nr:tetratricopeptide repeat protein [Fimbriimonadaceae bacterium]